tara:strand:+ start:126 stop:473 length:348 start_codon:yes stop_codon:yes gene_type:complete
MKIKTKGGTKNERQIAEKTVMWCMKHLGLGDNVLIFLRIKNYDDCWGSCVEGSVENSYRITVANEQSLRDFVATITHEMVHVMQWETGKWKGEGEAEANYWQYRLADRLWEADVL